VEDSFDYLQGTQRHEKILAQNHVSTRSHTGAKATEEALKSLRCDTVNSPYILLIATHGFFFPDPENCKEQRFGEENALKWNENPLFRSGLQRAFKMAGADFLLVSLWQVPDKETVEFMDAFYGAWLKGKTIHEAFVKAQKKMRKKYKEVYKWGAWVLVE
jgi:CHAT domain-containing protein